MKRIKIRRDEMGLYFYDGDFQALWGPGARWLFDPFKKANVEIVSQRDPWLFHEKLDVIVKSGVLKDLAVVLDLKDYERGLGLGGGPLQPHPAAWALCLLDGSAGCSRGSRGRSEHPLRARGLQGDRELANVGAIAGYLQGRSQLDGCAVQDGRYTDTLAPASTPSGETWPTRGLWKLICGKRRWTSAART